MSAYPEFRLTNKSSLSTITSGLGDAGSVIIKTNDSLGLFGGFGEDFTGRLSIFTQVEREAQGNAGDININSHVLTIVNGGSINAGTLGQGKGEVTSSILVKGFFMSLYILHNEAN